MWTSKFILYSLVAVISTILLHEFTHWIVGEFLGNDMRMTLNSGYPIAGKYKEDWHYPLISAMGPLITLLQAIVFFFLIKRSANKHLYPFLFTCFYMELLSGILTFRRPNDLGRIGMYLDIGLFTLPILFIATHFVLVYLTSKRDHHERKFILITLLLVIVFSSIWIGINQKFKVVLI